MAHLYKRIAYCLNSNLIIFNLLFSNCICMTCEHVTCALLLYRAFFARSYCFLVFQVIMTVLLTDMTASDMDSMWMYGMSTSASIPAFSFPLLGSFVKTFQSVFF